MAKRYLAGIIMVFFSLILTYCGGIQAVKKKTEEASTDEPIDEDKSSLWLTGKWSGYATLRNSESETLHEIECILNEDGTFKISPKSNKEVEVFGNYTLFTDSIVFTVKRSTWSDFSHPDSHLDFKINRFGQNLVLDAKGQTLRLTMEEHGESFHHCKGSNLLNHMWVLKISGKSFSGEITALGHEAISFSGSSRYMGSHLELEVTHDASKQLLGALLVARDFQIDRHNNFAVILSNDIAERKPKESFSCQVISFLR